MNENEFCSLENISMATPSPGSSSTTKSRLANLTTDSEGSRLELSNHIYHRRLGFDQIWPKKGINGMGTYLIFI